MFTKLALHYKEKYPTDDLGNDINPDITFRDLFSGLVNKLDAYELIGVYDSMIRERLFSDLAELLNVPYDYVYKLWVVKKD